MKKKRRAGRRRKPEQRCPICDGKLPEDLGSNQERLKVLDLFLTLRREGQIEFLCTLAAERMKEKLGRGGS